MGAVDSVVEVDQQPTKRTCYPQMWTDMIEVAVDITNTLCPLIDSISAAVTSISPPKQRQQRQWIPFPGLQTPRLSLLCRYRCYYLPSSVEKKEKTMSQQGERTSQQQILTIVDKRANNVTII